MYIACLSFAYICSPLFFAQQRSTSVASACVICGGGGTACLSISARLCVYICMSIYISLFYILCVYPSFLPVIF